MRMWVLLSYERICTLHICILRIEKFTFISYSSYMKIFSMPIFIIWSIMQQREQFVKLSHFSVYIAVQSNVLYIILYTIKSNLRKRRSGERIAAGMRREARYGERSWGEAGNGKAFCKTIKIKSGAGNA